MFRALCRAPFYAVYSLTRRSQQAYALTLRLRHLWYWYFWLTVVQKTAIDGVVRERDAAALRDLLRSNVRYGSGADIACHLANVRFAPQSGQSADMLACPLCAMCGRLRVGKENLHVTALGRCSHVFGL